MWFVIPLSNPNTNLEIALQQQCENYCAKNAYCIEIPRFHTGKKSRSVKNRLFTLFFTLYVEALKTTYLYWVTFSNKCAFNTKNWSYSIIVYLVKMGSEISNFGLKMTLIKCFLPLYGGNHFPLHKTSEKGKCLPKITNLVTKATLPWDLNK